MSFAVGILLRFVAMIALLLVNGVVLIYMLRKVLGHLHLRIGPNRVGPFGLLQTTNDVIKLLTKEDLRPEAADAWLFNIAPFLVFVPSFMAYIPLVFGPDLAVTNLDTGILLVFAVLSLVPIGVMMAGWASNAKWSLIGGMRAAGQQIAYEIPLLLSVLGPVMMAGSMDPAKIVAAQAGTWFGFIPRWFVIPQIVAFVVYVIAAQAETQQTPFDMSEAESELITGFANEYGGMRFGFLYLAEFSNMFIVAAIGTMLFFGGWQLPWVATPGWAAPFVFMFKTYLGIFTMMWARGSLPRFRVDQMLAFCWKRLIPISLVWVVVWATIQRLTLPGVVR
ncbi:MAG TPA: NADH-quinone oxidoreductase subunit NuoH [Coriobacteriia bacterium]